MTGLKTIPAHQAGVFTVFLPITAAAIGVAFFDEVMTGIQVIAFAIALVGVVLATLPKRGQRGQRSERAATQRTSSD